MHRIVTAIRRSIRAAPGTGKALAPVLFAPGMVLVRVYLVDACLDPELADRFGSPFGKTAPRLYREQYGTTRAAPGRWYAAASCTCTATCPPKRTCSPPPPNVPAA